MDEERRRFTDSAPRTFRKRNESFLDTQTRANNTARSRPSAKNLCSRWASMLNRSQSVGSWSHRSESERYESETNAIKNRSTTGGSSRRRDGQELSAGEPAIAAGNPIEADGALRRVRHASMAHRRRCRQPVRARSIVRGASVGSAGGPRQAQYRRATSHQRRAAIPRGNPQAWAGTVGELCGDLFRRGLPARTAASIYDPCRLVAKRRTTAKAKETKTRRRFFFFFVSSWLLDLD